MNAVSRGLSRRLILSRSAAVVGASSAGLLLPQIVRAQGNKVRVGFMLPYTGTYAQLGCIPRCLAPSSSPTCRRC